MKVVLPLRAEFGMKIYWHAPAVHAIAGEKIVYIEPGDEALYPSASKHIVITHQIDDQRRNRYSRDREFVGSIRESALRGLMMSDGEVLYPDQADILEPATDWPRKRFIPEPFKPVILTKRYDVIICPRRRIYGSEKNWPEWMHLTDWLVDAGISVFAAGAPDSSYQVNCKKAWDHERHLDATIEAMVSAKLVVATDAGLAHLAVLCGVPLMMITHGDGLVAPGPIIDETGKQFEPEYFPVKSERYEEANHRFSEITLLRHAWYDPAMVLNEVLRRVEA